MNKQLGTLMLMVATALGIAAGGRARHFLQGYLPDVQRPKLHHHHHHHHHLFTDLGHGTKLDQTGPNSIAAVPEITKLQTRLFLSPNYTLVQAQTRTTAVLHCEVSDIGNCTVTWKRIRDYQILTFGLLTYSSDSRFFTRNGKGGKDWSLHIRYVDTDDAGIYECQLSSHPPSSIFVELQLVEARAEIIGGPDKIVKAGSPLLLSCVLRRSTEAPEYIFWYHGERMINYDLGGGAAVRHGRQGSELLIPSAELRHTGNYSCVPSNARPDSVTVHILDSEKPAAMQHGSKSRATTSGFKMGRHVIHILLGYLTLGLNR